MNYLDGQKNSVQYDVRTDGRSDKGYAIYLKF